MRLNDKFDDPSLAGLPDGKTATNIAAVVIARHFSRMTFPRNAISLMVAVIRAQADETRRVGGIAHPLVLRLLGIGAERPGESRRLRRVLGRMRRQGLVRRRPHRGDVAPLRDLLVVGTTAVIASRYSRNGSRSECRVSS